MFGKGNFDGQFRTKPTVSIRGASQSENREQLLKRAHDERQNREVNICFQDLFLAVHAGLGQDEASGRVPEIPGRLAELGEVTQTS